MEFRNGREKDWYAMRDAEKKDARMRATQRAEEKRAEKESRKQAKKKDKNEKESLRQVAEEQRRAKIAEAAAARRGRAKPDCDADAELARLLQVAAAQGGCQTTTAATEEKKACETVDVVDTVDADDDSGAKTPPNAGPVSVPGGVENQTVEDVDADNANDATTCTQAPSDAPSGPTENKTVKDVTIVLDDD